MRPAHLCLCSLWLSQSGAWPVQVQHVYTVLQKSGGGTRRAALAELRQEYERSLKFSGKV